jgi:hypothetical protein
MENFLINYLLKNCVTLAKGFFSSEKATVEEGNNVLSFPNLLDAKLGGGITTPNTGIVDGVLSKENENETSGENSAKETDLRESPLNYFDTQSILASLQTHLKTQDMQDNPLQNNTRSITIEKFLQNVFSLLQEGESVQFLKEKSMGVISLAQTSKEEETAVETDQHHAVEPAEAMDNNALITYLALILQKFDVSEKTGKKTKNAKAEDTDKSVNKYEKLQSVEALKVLGTKVASKETVKVTDDMIKPLLNRTEMPVSFENENNGNKDIANSADAKVKSFPNIEVKKLNDRENVMQIISNESSSREGEEMNKNISALTVKMGKPSVSHDSSFPEFVSAQALSGENEEMHKNISILTVKTEKAALSRDDEVVGVVSKVTDKAANEHAGLDERRLLSQNDYAKTSVPLDKETGKVLEKTPFASVMTDRIEKIVEQYANKNVSMDMVVRLKIDEKETLLVGLKEQGQRVIVEVKTTNESMGSFLQSQKDEIARQLEGKHIYANIYVDVQNENREKREQRDSKQKKRSDEQEKQDFGGFLEAMA